MYQAEGLEAPAAVVTLTEDYRREMNPLTRWAEEECDLGPEHEATYPMLRASYEQATPVRERVGTKRFQRSLSGLPGVEYNRSRRIYLGIRVAEHDREDIDGTFRQLVEGL